MAGAVGIVFGLCVLSFTAGALLMYVVLRRREEQQAPEAPPVVVAPPPEDEAPPMELRWGDGYEAKPIHRNPVVGLPGPPDPKKPEEEEEGDVPQPKPRSVTDQAWAAPESSLPAPAEPHVTLPEQDEFRQRYLRTFEEARRRATGD